MKKACIVSFTGLFVFLVVACGGVSNEDACKKLDSLCSSTSGGDGGVSVTVKTTCSPDSFDKMDNGSDVKECIDKAADCEAAMKCMQTAKAG